MSRGMACLCSKLRRCNHWLANNTHNSVTRGRNTANQFQIPGLISVVMLTANQDTIRDGCVIVVESVFRVPHEPVHSVSALLGMFVPGICI
jgi:hypothetical protein